jgi:NAD(P)-dependent dehydrogenase (short-subunit alcohol dehydrogenase family)
MRLAGKVALVTRIGSGIGRACAQMFARQGAPVVACDLIAQAGDACADQMRSEGLSLHAVRPCDLTQPEEARRFVDEAAAVHAGIDVVVNTAARCAMVPIEQMDYEQHWRRTLTFELDLVFLVCQAAWPHLRSRGGGSIVNFASSNAYHALENSPALAHCAGKGGELAMTRQLAMEGAPHGIRANTISPGLHETSVTEPALRNIPGFRATVARQAHARPARNAGRHRVVRGLPGVGPGHLDHRRRQWRRRRRHEVESEPEGMLSHLYKDLT